MNRIYIIFFLILFSNIYSQYVFVPGSNPQEIDLHPFLKVINVHNLDLDLETAISQFKTTSSKQEILNKTFYGYTNDNYWGNLTIHNTSNNTLNYILRAATPTTYLVELYVVDCKSKKVIFKRNGIALRKTEKTTIDNEILFDLKIDPQVNLDLYIHIKTNGDAAGLPIHLYDNRYYITKNSNKNIVDGIFFGFVIQFTIFMFLIYLALRKIKILVLSGFILTSGLIPFLLDGYFSVCFNGNFGEYLNHLLLLSLILTGLLLGKFVELTLFIKNNNNSYVLFKLFYVLNISLFVSACVFSSQMSLFFNIASLMGFLLFVLIAFSVYKFKGKISVVEMFFIVAITILGIGYFVQNMMVNGFVDQNIYVENSAKISISLTIILFTIKEVLHLFKLRIQKNNLRNEALKKAKEMKDLKCYLLCNISHELRTPLNVIINLNKYILENSTDIDIIEKCENIQFSSENLLDSINDILDFSKIEKSELTLENIVFDPMKSLIKIKENTHFRAKENGLEFNFSLNDNFSQLVIGDEKKFSQIVNNLMSNALKFTNKGSISFNVESQLKVGNKVALIISISDTGLGIKKDRIESIFESFSQYRIDNKRKFGGLGLGLFLVKNLVSLLGGRFLINSDPGKGTSCMVEIDFDIPRL